MTAIEKRKIKARRKKLQRIKETIIGLIVIISFLAIVGLSENFLSHYNRMGIVQNIYNGIVTVKDTTDNLWNFEGSGYREGDIVKMRMYTSHTDTNIHDDEIVNVKIVK